MSENDDLLPDFIAESVDMIEKARHDIDTLLSGGDRAEPLNSIFRAVHTIKGGAGIFGFEKTKAIAHKLESLLGTLRGAPDLLSETDVSKIAKVIDHLEALLQNHDRLPFSAAEKPALEPEAPAQGASDDLSALSAELSRVAEEPPVQKEPAKTETPRPRHAPAPAALGPSAASPAPPAEMLRIPVERVQRNLDVISEVFLIRNQMTYLVEKHFSHSGMDHEFVQAWESLDNALRRSIGELENVAMSMRMMPLTGLFARMEKTVRAYVSETGKKIRIQKEGEDTELDKKVLDALGEPLIHLIRNAMDHGIENPQARQAAGKSDTGLITLSAKVAGNEVVLTIGDDGKGIVPDKIKAAAAAKGLDVSKVNDEKSAVELIFVPGFSTASSVTETSGRGVGMDVVKSAVERLGGNISIQTSPGEGTSFAIRLPLSMSVIPAIIVRLYEQLYAVGTGDIIETRRVSAREIQVNAGEAYLKYRGEFIPCYNLEDFLQTGAPSQRPYQSSVFVCVVRHKDAYVALRVGALENNTEVVVKPVPALAPQIPFVTGISVLPTGQPVFVLSLSRLCRQMLTAGGVVHEAA